MRRKVELSLNLRPDTASKLELDAETTDPGQVTFVVESLPASSDIASGVGFTASVGGCSAGPKTASIRVTLGGRATARNGA